MTDRQKYLLEVVQNCMLHNDFCDGCPNEPNGYESCRALHEEFFAEVCRSWGAEENEHGKETG